MSSIYLALFFTLTAMAGIMLKNTYFAVPLSELKKRAKNQDSEALKLHRAATYDYSLRLLLWLVISLSISASFVLLSRKIPLWAGIIVVWILIIALFRLLPRHKPGRLARTATSIITPALSWLLYYIHPLLNRTKHLIDSDRSQNLSVYDKQDLIKLLKQLKHQSGGRLNKSDVNSALRSLEFTDKKVSDVLIPKSKVKTIASDDVIGPILINEIHESGQNYVLIKDKANKQIVGTLAFKDLGIKSIGLVEDVMDKKVYFIHEDDDLTQAIACLYDSKYHLLVAVNSFQEFVGIVTIDSILEKLFGDLKVDEERDYTSLEKTAAKFSEASD